jgi:hypothetical protein
MRTLPLLAVAAIMLAGTPAFAQDSTTTTTTTTQTPGTSVTIEQNAPGTVESREVTGSVTECKSKTVTSQNDMGDTQTVHKEKCN